MISVQQLIDELSKIEDKSRPIKIGIQDGFWTGNYKRFDSDITVNDSWDGNGGVTIHVCNNEISFVDPAEIRKLHNLKFKLNDMKDQLIEAQKITKSVDSIVEDIESF